MIQEAAKFLGFLALLASFASADVTVRFPYDGASGLFGLQRLTLKFAVDLSGNVSMDASTTSGNPEIINAVNAFDNEDVGTVSDPVLYGESFLLLSITASETGNTLTLHDNDKGILGIQGQNSLRIDGADLSTPKPEALGWAVFGKVELAFQSFAYGNAHPSGKLKLSDQDTSVIYDLSGGSSSGAMGIGPDGFSIVQGQRLTFSVDETIAEGTGLRGFSFSVNPHAPIPAVIDLTPNYSTDGSFVTESFKGRTVWVPTNNSDQLFFDVPESFLFVPDVPVYVRVEYADSGWGRLLVEYDATTGDSTEGSEIHSRSTRINSGAFVNSYHQFEFPELQGGQGGGNDFRVFLRDDDGTPLRVASVQISDVPFDDERFLYALSKPWLLPYEGEVKDFVTTHTLSGKVMTGYQGWFRAPNDYRDGGWGHWGRGSHLVPDSSWMTIDAWPYLDDYDPESIYRAGGMTHLDGRPAYLFSSADPETVRRHFRWMRKHGIDGVYLQRFVTGDIGKRDFVLDNVRKAAAQEGRVWALEYDISSLTRDASAGYDIITADWTYLVEDCGILDDPRYVHEDGKPVLFIWGFSLRDHSIEMADAIVDWFRDNYDLYLITGVHSSWEDNTEWFDHYRKFDQLLAWMERSQSDLARQKATLESWGMKILPHAWPGFSWNHLQQTVFPYQYTARAGGQFYWDRLYNALSIGADQVFLGMFDEYDEATSLMPMSDNHPDIHRDSEGEELWGHYIDNEGRDPFWYLQLSGAAREILNGLRALSSTLPSGSELSPVPYGGDDATCYLQESDINDDLTHANPADGQTVPVVVNGLSARANSPGSTPASIYFYFDIDDEVCFANAAGQSATVEVEFHDSFPGTRLRLQYDSLGGAYKQHPVIIDLPDTGGWKTIRWNIDDAYFGGRQNGNSDLRIAVYHNETAAIRRVSVVFPEEQNGSSHGATPDFVYDETGVGWDAKWDAVGWRLFRSETLQEGSWEEASPLIFIDGKATFPRDPSKPLEFFRMERPDRR